MKVGNYGKQSSTETPDNTTARGSMVDKRAVEAAAAEDAPEVSVKEKPPTPASSILDALERGIQRDVDQLSGVVAPIKPYKERLADEGITLEQARHVLDQLLMHGDHYAEDVKIGPSTFVRFRTRQYLDTLRTYQAIEREAPRYANTTDNIQVRYMLAASLEAYGDRTFNFPDTTNRTELDTAFEERLLFIYKLSDFAVQVLAREFAKFDRKVSLILSDGAVEAF